MFGHTVTNQFIALLCPLLVVATFSLAQTPPANVQQAPTHANLLRGEYGRYRANNDLLSYHLDIRVDPEKKFINGKNTIRFKMLKDDARIQLDLYDNLKIDRIVQVNADKEKPQPRCRRSSLSATPALSLSIFRKP